MITKKYNEHQLQPEYAQEYGVNAAILLHNFIHWVTINKTNKTHFCDNRTWIYNSIEAFSSQYIYLTEKQIKYALDILRKNNVIVTGNYNRRKSDRTLWYAFVIESDFIPDDIMKITQDIDENLLKYKQSLVTKDKPLDTDVQPLDTEGLPLATEDHTLPDSIATNSIATNSIQKESKAATDDLQSSDIDRHNSVNMISRDVLKNEIIEDNDEIKNNTPPADIVDRNQQIDNFGPDFSYKVPIVCISEDLAAELIQKIEESPGFQQAYVTKDGEITNRCRDVPFDSYLARTEYLSTRNIENST